MKDVFADAYRARVALTKAQEIELRRMYSELAKDIAKRAQVLSLRSNISSVLQSKYLSDLVDQIMGQIDVLNGKQVKLVKSNMFNVVNIVVNNNTVFLNKLGFSVDSAFSYIPNQVVNEIITGKLYEGRWSLNSAIWKNTRKTQKDIDFIVAQGVAGQKSTYEIAKDLERYVNPRKKKDWSWSKVYPGTARVVDYNAQRLARTMLSHAYEDALVSTTKDNPFVECYRWLTSNSDRTCDVCIERAEGYHGVVINGEQMDGCYYADELPLDHPNGMCDFEPVIVDDMMSISNRLADWVNGKSDSGLDKFAVSLGYTEEDIKNSIQL